MLIRTAEQDIKYVLFTEEQIAGRVSELAKELCARLEGKRPLMICVLRGASFFFADLCRKMTMDLDMDFIAVSSYGSGATSSGAVRLLKDTRYDVEGRDLVLVEDIIDSGLTIQYLKRLYAARNPASITTVSFLDKDTGKPGKPGVDLCGYTIANEFVVGYGLDYADHYRNLPYIGVIKPECYQ